MTAVLIAVIFIMAMVIYSQYLSRRKRNRDLKYISEKLDSIVFERTGEKLMLLTDDSEMIPILNEINNLVDFSQKTLAGYAKTEIAMKKMLSNISHDLKTPLTVVLGYIEALQLNPGMDGEEREIMLSRVGRKAREVLDLINKFFDLAKLESGDIDIPITRININEVCKKNMLAHYDILTAKGFVVSIDIPAETVYISGNEEALNRIMDNLISNAIKYGSDGKDVGLSLKYDKEFVYVDIWDKGKGISELNQERIFERMYTLEDSRNRLYQGSGLGLTITKKLVEELEGKIFVNSQPYKKTTFTFRLKRMVY